MAENLKKDMAAKGSAKNPKRDEAADEERALKIAREIMDENWLIFDILARR